MLACGSIEVSEHGAELSCPSLGNGGETFAAKNWRSQGMGHVMQRLVLCAAICLTVIFTGSGAFAEDAKPEDAKQETHEEPIKQIKLTETQVSNFISAQPDLA